MEYFDLVNIKTHACKLPLKIFQICWGIIDNIITYLFYFIFYNIFIVYNMMIWCMYFSLCVIMHKIYSQQNSSVQFSILTIVTRLYIISSLQIMSKSFYFWSTSPQSLCSPIKWQPSLYFCFQFAFLFFKIFYI